MGVQQSSILSPLLFNIMLSDFPKPNGAINVLIYADDVEVDVEAGSLEEAESINKAIRVPRHGCPDDMQVH